MTNYVAALFEDFDSASQAIKDLVNNGVDRKDISFVARDQNNEYAREIDPQGNVADKKQPLNSSSSQRASGLDKILADLGIISIQGLGSSMTAGPINGLMKDSGDLVGALTRAGIPQDAAQEYAEGVRWGDSLVLVKTDDGQSNKVLEILNHYHLVDIQSQAGQWRKDKWTGFDPNAQPPTTEEIDQQRERYQTNLDQPGETTIPVIEEELRTGKRQVTTGGARIHTNVTEEPVEETVNLRQERVQVERNPVDREVSPEDIDAFQEGTMEVTETGEEVVSEKRAHVVEEVKVRKDAEERQETVHDTVRKTHVDVEGGDTPVENENTTSFTEYEPTFRNHFTTTYSNSGYSYDQYRPYYEYGYDLGLNESYSGMSWKQVERQANEQWQSDQRDIPWEQFKEAVRAGFMAAREA